MADVLIKGMEMPQTCWNCRLKVGFHACGIVIDHKDGGFFYRVHQGNSRPDWCPIVHLPEKHGRLGDLDALFEEVYKVCGTEYDASECNTLMGLINDAPTIIEAEGGGEDG